MSTKCHCSVLLFHFTRSQRLHCKAGLHFWLLENNRCYSTCMKIVVTGAIIKCTISIVTVKHKYHFDFDLWLNLTMNGKKVWLNITDAGMRCPPHFTHHCNAEDSTCLRVDSVSCSKRTELRHLIFNDRRLEGFIFPGISESLLMFFCVSVRVCKWT